MKPFQHHSMGAQEKFHALRAGFTLIELLVVIAIIGILASMLLPALTKGKLKATGVKCINNQKQLMLGFAQFATDENDMMIPSAQGGGYWVPTDAAGVPLADQRPVGLVAAAGGSTATARLMVEASITASPLFKYVPVLETFICPGDKRDTRPLGAGWGIDSYAKVNGLRGPGWTGQTSFTYLGEVQDPTETLVFIESTDQRGFNWGTWVIDTRNSGAPAQNPGWVDPFAAFHGSASTASFADGHVEMHAWVDGATIKAAQDMAGGAGIFSWSGGGRGNPDFEWIYERYKYANWAPLP